MAVVRLLGGRLRRLLGDKQVPVRPGPVAAVLDQLVERGGDELANLLFDRPCVDGRECRAEPAFGRDSGWRRGRDGTQLSRDLRILLNGRSVAFLDGLDTPVAESDCLTLHLAGIRGFPGG